MGIWFVVSSDRHILNVFVWFGSQQLSQNPSANLSFLWWIPKIYLWDSSRTLGHWNDSVDVCTHTHTRHVSFSFCLQSCICSFLLSEFTDMDDWSTDTFHGSNWILENCCVNLTLKCVCDCLCYIPVVFNQFPEDFTFHRKLYTKKNVFVYYASYFNDLARCSLSRSSAVECLFLICCLCFCGISECYHIPVFHFDKQFLNVLTIKCALPPHASCGTMSGCPNKIPEHPLVP